MAQQTSATDRAVTASTAGSPGTPNTLPTAHHFVSVKLTSRNYIFWRAQLIPFLRGQGLLGYIDSSCPCPPATVLSLPTAGSSVTAAQPTPNPEHIAWVQQDQSIMSLLISSLIDEVMYLILGRNTAKEVWDSISAALASSSRPRCLNLLGQLQTLRQGNSTPAEYIGKAQLIVEALALADRPLAPYLAKLIFSFFH